MAKVVRLIERARRVGPRQLDADQPPYPNIVVHSPIKRGDQLPSFPVGARDARDRVVAA